MKYNILMDVTSLVFLSIVTWRFSFQRKLPIAAIKSFGWLLIVANADLVFDIAGCLCINYAQYVPIWASYMINGAYYVIQIAFPSAVVFYLIALLYANVDIKKYVYTMASVPVLIYELVLVVSIPFGWVYSIAEDGSLVNGPFSMITYVSGLTYLLGGTILGIKYRKHLYKEVQIAFFSSIGILALSMVLQRFFTYTMIIGTALTAAFVIMFFVIQNPADLTDAVTGIPNNRAFMLVAKERYKRKSKLKIVVVGIDGLSRVNTLYGSEQGDVVLRNIANFLSAQKHSWTYRLNGTHFVIITYDTEVFNSITDSISKNRYSEWPVNDGQNKVSIKFSVCEIKNAELMESVEMLLEVINRAIVLQEQNPEYEFVFEIDEKMSEDLKRSALVENVIRSHLDDGSGFYMEYQPIFDLKEGRYKGAEALLRFNCEELGSVSPALFIPIMEKCGLSIQIDKMVVEKVFDDIHNGVFDELDYDHIHINLSAATFATPNMLYEFMELSERYRIKPEFIVLEITESISASASLEDFKSCMKTLIKHGFVFALDDFGTGYSNIARILQLPFSIIKLDRSLLVESGEAYVELAHMIQHLDLDIVTEGVETEEQLAYVKEAGVRYVQGWYFSKSLPPEKLKEL